MRSRFTAFSIKDAAYLLETWHPSTRPAEIDLDDDCLLYTSDAADE